MYIKSYKEFLNESLNPINIFQIIKNNKTFKNFELLYDNKELYNTFPDYIKNYIQKVLNDVKLNKLKQLMLKTKNNYDSVGILPINIDDISNLTYEDYLSMLNTISLKSGEIYDEFIRYIDSNFDIKKYILNKIDELEPINKYNLFDKNVDLKERIKFFKKNFSVYIPKQASTVFKTGYNNINIYNTYGKMLLYFSKKELQDIILPNISKYLNTYNITSVNDFVQGVLFNEEEFKKYFFDNNDINFNYFLEDLKKLNNYVIKYQQSIENEDED